MAKKNKTAYFCQQCGFESPKWVGKCPSCGSWNSFVEELLADAPAKTAWNPGGQSAPSKPLRIDQIEREEQPRIVTADDELNRVLGGGIMPGSIVLIGGEPGIGKSTLLLQLALSLPSLRILYVSGEESARQIRLRADRMAFQSPNCFLLTETNTQSIFKQVEQLSPELLIIDSIQTLHAPHIDSPAGSVSQVRECTGELIRYAKESGVPVFVIGHITKEGTLAGPKVLEHMVDTVLQFEGDRHMSYRILRTIKNRFGSTAELGIYEMISNGLRQVTNPSEILLSQRDSDLSGIAIGATLEGNRPLLIEVQSLVSPSAYGTPQRSPTGFDAKRLNMLLAVLEKRGGYKVNFQDVFLNITGGLRIEDPAIDLAVCMSVISAHDDLVIPTTTCFAAEVGLGGEVRAVNRLDSRISEAEKLGFKRIYVSKFNVKSQDTQSHQIEVIPVGRLDEVIERLFA